MVGIASGGSSSSSVTITHWFTWQVDIRGGASYKT